MDFELTDRPKAADLETLADGLDAHAADITPPRNKQDVAVFVRENGRILAGLYGATYWDWLHIKLLWVDESLRGQGVGQRLMQMAEAEAAQRGCHAALVDTHSFQAEGFYARLGYEVFGRLEDFPLGHQRIYLQKRLTS
jgi:GNAT superfamily N-acetyltransferase